ncbi:hypothetical protein IAU59_006684 [Kwoniella sp. CBS 9459]
MPPRTRAASGVAKRVVAESRLPLPAKRRKTAKVATDGAKDDASSRANDTLDTPALVTAITPSGKSSSQTSVPHQAVLSTQAEAATSAPEPPLIPPTLSFSLQDAITHLSKVDPRFSLFFVQIPCRPFVHLEAVDPFRTLVTSIIGQQVSWLAARAINSRFRALFGFDDETKVGFPSAADVAKEDVLRLKSVGLSTRKAEYVISLAQHFVSGQLTTTLLHHGTDEEISQALVAVRGIGQWTVDMFLMFSLRRPDVLAVGDLGVQKGLLRWILSAHDALPPATPKKGTPKKKSTTTLTPTTPSKTTTASPAVSPTETITVPPETLPPSPAASLPVRELLRRSGSHTPAALPADLSIEVLRARLNGKKVKGGMYLTPDEMIRLTEPWRPYRSLGVFYMWPVAEE